MQTIKDDTLKEQETVRRLIKGDEKAFCELYATYKKRLLYFSLSFVKSPEFAEDVFQDAFTIVWQSRNCINPNKSFSSFLFTIVRNRILNLLRNIEHEMNLKNHIISNAIDYTDETNEVILHNDLKNALNKALDRLTVRQRQVFEMSREMQLSNNEIAETLGISVSMVQEHICSSLKVIRQYLNKYPSSYSDLILILICLNL